MYLARWMTIGNPKTNSVNSIITFYDDVYFLVKELPFLLCQQFIYVEVFILCVAVIIAFSLKNDIGQIHFTWKYKF